MIFPYTFLHPVIHVDDLDNDPIYRSWYDWYDETCKVNDLNSMLDFQQTSPKAWLDHRKSLTSGMALLANHCFAMKSTCFFIFDQLSSAKHLCRTIANISQKDALNTEPPTWDCFLVAAPTERHSGSGFDPAGRTWHTHAHTHCWQLIGYWTHKHWKFVNQHRSAFTKSQPGSYHIFLDLLKGCPKNQKYSL